MVVYDSPRVLTKRNPTLVDTTDLIQRFGVDNLYPQRAEEVVKGSYTLKSVCDVVADFLNGEGFADQIVAKTILNSSGLKGMTANKVLRQVTKTYSKWNTVCLHIGYNMNFRISSIKPVPFSYIRFGLADSNGRVKQLAYSTNWERDGRKECKDRQIIYYPTFNPDPNQIALEINEAGGIDKYKGQILYGTPEEFVYPNATFDPVIDHAETQFEIGQSKIGNVRQSFLATLAIVYPGEFGSLAEEHAFKDLIASKKGARRAGSTIGLQDKTGTRKASDIFQVLTPANLDKLFEFTEKSCVDAIMENEAMPKELLGVRPESGMFNQDNMENAYTYFNSRTRNRRADISELFSMLFSYWEHPIQTDAYITPQRYVQEGQDANGDGAVEINEALKNMTGRQAQNFSRILRQFGKGQISEADARIKLQGGFGLTNEQIDSLLGIGESEDPAPQPQA
jgi:hypothetical protein